VLRKVKEEKVDVTLILPLWLSQFWFGTALQMAIEAPRLLPNNKLVINLPQEPERSHNLWNRLKLTFLYYRAIPQVQDYQNKLQGLSGRLGEMRLKNSIGHITTNGCCFVVNEKLLPMSSTVNVLLEFLAQLFELGLSYSAINTAKSAVIMFVSLCSGDFLDSNNMLIQKFMRGVFAQRPALPRYCIPWDTSIVLRYLKGQFPLEAISLLSLSRKLAMLLVLLSGQRGRSIHLLDLSLIECKDDLLVLRFGQLLKMSRPGRHLEEITLPAYKNNAELCIVKTFKAYVRRTLSIRQTKRRLFLSTIRPHAPVSRDTIGKWIKYVLGAAGIDLKIFGTHSTRAAATSKACGFGVPLQTIIKTAGWTNNQTFRKYYDRPISRNTEFASAILDDLNE